MNDHDPLEAELAALRPAPTSPQLRERIASELGSNPRNQRPARQVEPAWAFASGMLAASILVLLCWLATDRQPSDVAGPLTGARNGQETGHSEIAAALDPALPSLWTYRRALAAGPHELDAALAEHAQHGRSLATPVHDLQIGPMRGFVSSEAEFHSSIQGDL